MSIRSRALTVAALVLGVAQVTSAQAPQTFTPKSIVKLAQGGERERAAFSRMPGLAALVQGQFGVGAQDLNADGTPELVLVSLTCDAAGCPVVILQNKGPGNVTPIFAQKVTGRLAITNETVNGFNAVAAADQAGAIMKDATGKQLVYTLPTAQAAAANAAPAKPAQPVPPAAPPPRATPPAATPPAAAPGVAQTGKGEFLPLCNLPTCLNPRVLTKSGFGTANAKAEAKVTVQDATPWCAQNQPLYKGCVEDAVEYGGAADRYNNIDFKASANCETGQLTAVDEIAYTYVGMWPSGGPGAGRPRFKGPYTTDGTTQFEQQGAVQVASGAYSISEVANMPNSGESLATQWDVLCGAKAPAR